MAPVVAIENPYSTIFINENILYVFYKQDVVIDLDVLKRVIADRLSISANKKWPIFVDSSKAKYWTIESRKYAFSEEGLEGVLVFAVLSNNIVGTTIVNWVNKFLDTKVPFKLFTDKDKAVQWLKDNYVAD